MDEPENYLVRLYTEHYRHLLYLAALFADDRAQAEDIAQDAFVSVYRSRHRLRQPESGLNYLRAAVINHARSRRRRCHVAAKHQTRLLAPTVTPDRAGETDNRELLRLALTRLPPRQREAVLLRHYADLSEKQAAEVMGVGVGAVKSQCSRGIAALKPILRELNH